MGTYARYVDELDAVFRVVATLLHNCGHLVINAATTVNEDGPTPLADDIADRVARHLVRRGDLSIAWDATPTGILDDRCLVFEKMD
jgi:hypothetical protein